MRRERGCGASEDAARAGPRPRGGTRTPHLQPNSPAPPAAVRPPPQASSDKEIGEPFLGGITVPGPAILNVAVKRVLALLL